MAMATVAFPQTQAALDEEKKTTAGVFGQTGAVDQGQQDDPQTTALKTTAESQVTPGKVAVNEKGKAVQKDVSEDLPKQERKAAEKTFALTAPQTQTQQADTAPKQPMSKAGQFVAGQAGQALQRAQGAFKDFQAGETERAKTQLGQYEMGREDIQQAVREPQGEQFGRLAGLVSGQQQVPQFQAQQFTVPEEQIFSQLGTEAGMANLASSLGGAEMTAGERRFLMDRLGKDQAFQDEIARLQGAYGGLRDEALGYQIDPGLQTQLEAAPGLARERALADLTSLGQGLREEGAGRRPTIMGDPTQLAGGLALQERLSLADELAQSDPILGGILRENTLAELGIDPREFYTAAQRGAGSYLSPEEQAEFSRINALLGGTLDPLDTTNIAADLDEQALRDALLTAGEGMRPELPPTVIEPVAPPLEAVTPPAAASPTTVTPTGGAIAGTEAYQPYQDYNPAFVAGTQYRRGAPASPVVGPAAAPMAVSPTGSMIDLARIGVI